MCEYNAPLVPSLNIAEGGGGIDIDAEIVFVELNNGVDAGHRHRSLLYVLSPFVVVSESVSVYFCLCLCLYLQIPPPVREAARSVQRGLPRLAEVLQD